MQASRLVGRERTVGPPCQEVDAPLQESNVPPGGFWRELVAERPQAQDASQREKLPPVAWGPERAGKSAFNSRKMSHETRQQRCHVTLWSGVVPGRWLNPIESTKRAFSELRELSASVRRKKNISPSLVDLPRSSPYYDVSPAATLRRLSGRRRLGYAALAASPALLVWSLATWGPLGRQIQKKLSSTVELVA